MEMRPHYHIDLIRIISSQFQRRHQIASAGHTRSPIACIKQHQLITRIDHHRRKTDFHAFSWQKIFLSQLRYIFGKLILAKYRCRTLLGRMRHPIDCGDFKTTQFKTIMVRPINPQHRRLGKCRRGEWANDIMVPPMQLHLPSTNCVVK